MPYWVEFEDRRPACVHSVRGTYEQATKLFPNPDDWAKRNDYLEAEVAHFAGLFGAVKCVHSLPYGASPSLDGSAPGDFCFSPERCKGAHSCPHNYACFE